MRGFENEVRDIPVAGDNYTFGRVFNTYDAKTDIQLGATKTLDGAAASDPFSFTITEVMDAEGTPLDSGDAFTDTKSNGADGKVTFEKIEYTAADASSEGRKHYYKIVENAGEDEGIIYDNKSYIVTVTVTDDGNGHLTATPDKSADDVVFENETKKGPLTITKTFDGDEDKLSQDQKDGVTFHVTGPNDYDTTFTYADMAEGSKTLEELMPGEYRVEESNQFFDGYTCATTYQVGSESSQKVDLTADGAAISVTNTYTKNTVKQALSVTKEVTGNDFTGDEDFSFTLAKAEGSTASTDLLPEEKDCICEKWPNSHIRGDHIRRTRHLLLHNYRSGWNDRRYVLQQLSSLCKSSCQLE